ncbi:uncharacterized protein LOC131936392 [Physella acuta]|uniref:uncharacterized protein LOC131936392 n=1 Tax=Physella acuta TaxID=109671 RepID=UPI0027DD52A5|nr:uncharacterized protein LOC131936392 [Physella acuta]
MMRIAIHNEYLEAVLQIDLLTCIMSPLWVLVLLPALTLGDTVSDVVTLHAKLDVNRDGDLSKEELLSAVRVYDYNKDNAMSMQELFDFLNANVINLTKEAMTWGKYIDVNKDGIVTMVEFDAAFQAIDGNWNGKLDKMEFLGYVLKMIPVLMFG